LCPCRVPCAFCFVSDSCARACVAYSMH
jgi:hypothetical protein